LISHDQSEIIAAQYTVMTYRKAIFHSVVLSQIYCRIFILHIFFMKEKTANYFSSRERMGREEEQFCKKNK